MKRAVACLAVAIVGLLSSAAAADCCNDCGCECRCCKVCRCVPEVKKVSKICYDCKCEDFCVPGPSKICGYKCACGEDCPCEHHLFHHKEPIWQPTCAKVYTRHVLVKKELTKEVCGWKWEVVDLCPHCSSCCSHHAAAPPKGTQPNAVQSQAIAANAADDYYGQNAVRQAGCPAGGPRSKLAKGRPRVAQRAKQAQEPAAAHVGQIVYHRPPWLQVPRPAEPKIHSRRVPRVPRAGNVRGIRRARRFALVAPPQPVRRRAQWSRPRPAYIIGASWLTGARRPGRPTTLSANHHGPSARHRPNPPRLAL